MCLQRTQASCPGLLGELAALAEVLDRAPDWKSNAVGVRARMLAILGDVAERYLQQGMLHVAHDVDDPETCVCVPLVAVWRC